MAKKAAPAKAASKTAAKAKAEPKAKAKAKPAKEAKPKKAVEQEQEAVAADSSVEEVPAKAPKVKAEKVKKIRKSSVVDTGAGSEHHNKWLDMKEKHAKDKAATYAMSGTFEAHQPIQHKTLGWGLILSNNNDRLEVLFETGVKILISNYKQ